MDDDYASRHALIVRRAGERNVDLTLVEAFFEKKIKDIEANYPNEDDYTEHWRLARAEYLVWERFFPTEPFPDPEVVEKPPPPQAMASLPQKPKDPTRMDWIHDKYDPNAQPRLGDSVSRRGDYYTPVDSRAVAPKMNPRNGDHYSPPRKESSVAIKEEESGPVKIAPQGPNARQRMTATEIAAFDVQNPTRLSQGVVFGTQMKQENAALNALQPSTQSAVKAAPVLRLESKLIQNQAVGNSDNRYPLAYANTRDSAAPANRSQSNPIRPQMVGHSLRSTLGSSHRDLNKERARERQTKEEPGEAYMNQEKEMERRAIRAGFRAEMFMYLQKARDQARQGHSRCSRYVRGYLSDRKTWEHFWPQDKFPGVEPRTGHTQECLRRSSRLLNIPIRNDVPIAGAAPGMASLAMRPARSPLKLGWGGRLSPISPADFTPKVRPEPRNGNVSFEAMGAFMTEPVAEAGPPAAVANAPQLIGHSPSPPKPQVFQDPEEMWKKFKSAFRVSDSDRSKMEKNVKSQGQLRMVLDEPSGQIITVEELIKRTQYRYALNSKMGGSKRKAEADADIEKERAQKRAATFLDSLNSM